MVKNAMFLPPWNLHSNGWEKDKKTFNEKLTFIEHLLWARHFLSYLKYTDSFNPHNSLIKQIPTTEKEGTEKLNNLSHLDNY